MGVEEDMPDKRAIEKARRDKREGKSASTQAGEFVREEIDKIRHGEHGARSTKQAIAIGWSDARVSIYRRRKAARPPSGPAGARNMPMRRGRAGAKSNGGRGCRAR